MRFFTMDNTDGYTQDQIKKFNEVFPEFAQKNGFNLEDENQLKSCVDKFHNEVAIHG